MLKKLSLLSIALCVMVAASLAVTPIFAQEAGANTSLNNRTQIRARLKELQDKVDQNLTPEQKLERLAEFTRLAAFERCQLRERNFSARMEYYQLMRDRQSQIYNRVMQNIQRGIDRLKKLNKDTKDLEAAAKTMQGFIDSVRSSYFDTEEAMKKVLPQICDIQKRDQVDIKNMETQLDNLRKQDAGIRKYMKETILPLLKKTAGVATSSSTTST